MIRMAVLYSPGAATDDRTQSRLASSVVPVQCVRSQGIGGDGRSMDKNRPTLDDLTQRLLAFRDARDWRQFHALKDLILSLNLEAGELLELTQWKSEVEFERDAKSEGMRRQLAEECADILLYLLLIAERTGIDLQTVAAQKITANDVKYPVAKARGTAAKYTEL